MKNFSTILQFALAAVALLLPVACKKNPSYGPSENQVQAERIGKLRNEILAMAPPRGCQKAAECQVLELGYNRCGGPRQYLVYCSNGADASSLKAKTDELLSLEKEEAEKQGEPPPCKKIDTPQIELVDGSCRAK